MTNLWTLLRRARSVFAVRARLCDVPIGAVGVLVSDYAVQPCPCCGRIAAWVRGELCCVTCGCRYVPDRTFLARIERSLDQRGYVAANGVDALQVVLHTRAHRGGWA